MNKTKNPFNLEISPGRLIQEDGIYHHKVNEMRVDQSEIQRIIKYPHIF